MADSQAGARPGMLAGRMNGFQGPVHLALRASALLRAGVIAAHVVASLAVALLLPPSVPWAALLAAIATHGCAVARRLHRRSGGDVAAILLDSAGQWQVTLCDGSVIAAQLAPRPFVTPHLTALTLRLDDGRRRHVLLLGDNVDADPYRRLRVRLRFARD